MTEESRGRPARKYPPRIDATPEALARVVLNGGRPKGSVKGLVYRCAGCGREVSYPGGAVSRWTVRRMHRDTGSVTGRSAKIHYNSQLKPASRRFPCPSSHGSHSAAWPPWAIRASC